MLLYLMRHGIAIDRDDPGCPDEFERFLTDKGIKKTRQAARGLAKLGVAPTRVLTSPLVRAVQTAQIAAEELGVPTKHIEQLELLIYGQPPLALLRNLRNYDDDQILCCGHAPHLDEVIAAAVGAPRPFTELKKAGTACIDLESIHPPRGIVSWVLTPAACCALADR